MKQPQDVPDSVKIVAWTITYMTIGVKEQVEDIVLCILQLSTMISKNLFALIQEQRFGTFW